MRSPPALLHELFQAGLGPGRNESPPQALLVLREGAGPASSGPAPSIYFFKFFRQPDFPCMECTPDPDFRARSVPPLVHRVYPWHGVYPWFTQQPGVTRIRPPVAGT